MSGYRALDLTALCTTPGTVFPDPATVPRGDVAFHGLPFRVGAGDGPVASYLCLGRAHRPAVDVPVGGRPTWLVFAHALLDSELFEGGEVGRTCAEYTLRYADGGTRRVPVRERFEIAVSPQDRPDRPIPLDWGQTPFLALPDLEPTLPHRTVGRFDATGGRFKDVDDPSTRVPYRLPHRFFLWPLANPRADVDLVAVELRSLGPALVVAGITVGELDEEPFGRTVFQDVLLTLPPGERDIETLTVAVERGSASFPYWTVADPADLPAPPSVPGWGQDAVPRGPRRAHVRIAANPSARVALRDGDTEIAATGWGELLDRGATTANGVTFTLAEPGRTWVRTTIRDADTGEPVPCRVHFASGDGVPLAPHGHPVHINSGMRTHNLDIGGDVRLGGRTYAYVDGTCEGWLPIGEVVVELARGFEYAPVRERVTIAPGQRTLDLEIRRIADMAARHWFGGDTHVHFVSTVGAETEARGEDLRVVNLLRTQGAELFTLTEEFTGEPHASADERTWVHVCQENRTGMFGHLNLLGLRAPVLPLSTGGPDESEVGGGLETGLAHWADECHAQGGTAVLAHFPVPNGEAAALIASGRLDAVEMVAHDPYNLGEYYRYLDDGYRLPLVGGTDKMTAEVPVGLVRTYVHIPPHVRFDYFSWAARIRDGHQFVSSGPLLEATVDGHPPGAEVAVTGTAHVAVTVRSIFPVDRVEVVGRGGVLAERVVEPTHELATTFDVAVPADTWLAVRCAGPGVTGGRHHDAWRRPVTAHTSPFHLRTGAEYRVRDPRVTAHMLTLIEGAVEHIRQRARRFWPGPVTHRHGTDDHLAYLLAPYEQARAAIRARG